MDKRVIIAALVVVVLIIIAFAVLTPHNSPPTPIVPLNPPITPIEPITPLNPPIGPIVPLNPPITPIGPIVPLNPPITPIKPITPLGPPFTPVTPLGPVYTPGYRQIQTDMKPYAYQIRSIKINSDVVKSLAPKYDWTKFDQLLGGLAANLADNQKAVAALGPRSTCADYAGIATAFAANVGILVSLGKLIPQMIEAAKKAKDKSRAIEYANKTFEAHLGALMKARDINKVAAGQCPS